MKRSIDTRLETLEKQTKPVKPKMLVVYYEGGEYWQCNPEGGETRTDRTRLTESEFQQLEADQETTVILVTLSDETRLRQEGNVYHMTSKAYENI